MQGACEAPLLLCPSITIRAAGSAAVGLDMASAEYVHWDGLGGTPAGYNLGGGGVVADVVVVGGRAGVRTAATQVRQRLAEEGEGGAHGSGAGVPA